MSVEKIDHIDIALELKRLHKELKEVGRVRACLFNLVVYTKGEARREQFKNILQATIRRFPCRILFIEHVDDPSYSELEVEVTSEGDGSAKNSFACDQIAIRVGGSMVERVPYLVIPNFVPDLPIYLLWGEDPTEREGLLPLFEPYASRLIFDTEYTRDLKRFASVMLEKMKRVDYAIRDIHWGLTGPFRDALAQTFDSSERIGELKEASEIAIQYSEKEGEKQRHSERQALYLQAWIAGQFNWRLASAKKAGGKLSFDYKKNGDSVKITLEPRASPHFLQGSILSIDIACKERVSYSLKRMETLPKLSVHITCNDLCKLPFTLPLPNLQYGFSFMKELFYEKTSNHYRNMLKVLEAVNWKEVFHSDGKL